MGNFPLFVNRYEEGFELREHNHAYIEVVYVLSGEGFHYIGTGVEKTSKGSLYILPVGTSHLFRPTSPANPHKLLVYNLCIRPEFIDELAYGLDIMVTLKPYPYLKAGQIPTFLLWIRKWS